MKTFGEELRARVEWLGPALSGANRHGELLPNSDLFF